MSASSDYLTLLDATINHLEAARRRGERFVTVDASLLKELAQPHSVHAARPAVASASAPSVRPEPAPAAPATVSVADLPAPFPGVAPSVPAASPSQPITDKDAAIAELKERVLRCVTCAHLASSRKSVVFGVGSIHASLMFVGEAPGADEDLAGEPFIGAAGQLLTKIIQTMGLSRESVYIANVLKCRPDTPGERSGNRKPTHEEMATCLPYLREQIRIIQPQVIVALGATAVEGLFARSPIAISKLRGQWMQYDGIDVMPTFHPSYVLRNQALATKRETWEDMLAAMERLGMPISEKQRGYFLR